MAIVISSFESSIIIEWAEFDMIKKEGRLPVEMIHARPAKMAKQSPTGFDYYYSQMPTSKAHADLINETLGKESINP